MKYILVEDNTNIIKDYGNNYMQHNNSTIVLDNQDNVIYIYPDYNTGNSTIYGVGNIEDYVGNKYLYSGGLVSLNPDYEELEA